MLRHMKPFYRHKFVIDGLIKKFENYSKTAIALSGSYGVTESDGLAVYLGISLTSPHTNSTLVTPHSPQHHHSHHSHAPLSRSPLQFVVMQKRRQRSQQQGQLQ
jgi:hypothetical protein